jgi:hypothetical protein
VGAGDAVGAIVGEAVGVGVADAVGAGEADAVGVGEAEAGAPGVGGTAVAIGDEVTGADGTGEVETPPLHADAPRASTNTPRHFRDRLATRSSLRELFTTVNSTQAVLAQRVSRA